MAFELSRARNRNERSKIRFLLGLIVADEEKHHELTARMISKLKDELAWTRSTGIARRPGESGEKAKRLLASVENFMDAERKGIKEYERLKKESRGLYRDLFALLYTTLIHDSQTHGNSEVPAIAIEGRPAFRSEATNLIRNWVQNHAADHKIRKLPFR